MRDLSIKSGEKLHVNFKRRGSKDKDKTGTGGGSGVVDSGWSAFEDADSSTGSGSGYSSVASTSLDSQSADVFRYTYTALNLAIILNQY